VSGHTDKIPDSSWQGMMIKRNGIPN